MSNKRLSSFPDVPAIGELGYGNDLEVQAWQGVLVRSGTRATITEMLYHAIAKGMAFDDPKQGSRRWRSSQRRQIRRPSTQAQ